jgi:hypothetical protein
MDEKGNFWTSTKKADEVELQSWSWGLHKAGTMYSIPHESPSTFSGYSLKCMKTL